MDEARWSSNLNWYSLYKQSQSEEQKSFFVDLDETLVKSLHLKDYAAVKGISLQQASQDSILNGYKPISDGMIVKKRPYADEFLSHLQNMGNLYLLTASDRVYADEVLDVLDMNVFDAKFYGEDLDTNKSLSFSSDFYLFDNLPQEKDKIKSKMALLGEYDSSEINDRHIKVIAYEPMDDQEENGLNLALSDLNAILGLD